MPRYHDIDEFWDNAKWWRPGVGGFATSRAAARYRIIKQQACRFVECPVSALHRAVWSVFYPNPATAHLCSVPCAIGSSNNDNAIFACREVASLAV